MFLVSLACGSLSEKLGEEAGSVLALVTIGAAKPQPESQKLLGGLGPPRAIEMHLFHPSGQQAPSAIHIPAPVSPSWFAQCFAHWLANVQPPRRLPTRERSPIARSILARPKSCSASNRLCA